MTTPERLTQRELLEVVEAFQASDWRAMTLEADGVRIAVGKDGPPTTAAPPTAATPATEAAPDPKPVERAPSPAAAPESFPPARSGTPEPVDRTGCVEVRSPAVGAFWIAPSPGEPPFVEPGQPVSAHEQLAIVEVMKLMNPVIAPQDGVVVEVCAANAELVEFDQPLFLIRPTDD